MKYILTLGSLCLVSTFLLGGLREVKVLALTRLEGNISNNYHNPIQHNGSCTTGIYVLVGVAKLLDKLRLQTTSL